MAPIETVGNMQQANKEIWQWDAVEVAAAIRGGHISCREATVANLERLDQVNPQINAVVDVLAQDALRAADQADLAVRGGADLGPLHGVPVTIKISNDYKGRPTTHGVVAFKNNVAPDDGSATRNLRKAGAIVLGLTNVPALTARYFSDNDLHGRTFNPWDRETTPGGSSGGASAAVAAGIGALAQGSDWAGSIRYPAFACGVAGVRPSFGRVPDYQPTSQSMPDKLTLQLAAVDGLLARRVRDLRVGLEALSGKDERSMTWWSPAPFVWPDSGRPCRVALVRRTENFVPVPAVDASLLRAAKALEDAGYHVEEAVPPHMEEAAELWPKLCMNDGRVFENGVDTTRDRRKVLADEATANALDGWFSIAGELDLAAFCQGFKRRLAISQGWSQFFAKYPLVLSPCSAMSAFPVDYDQAGVARMHEIIKAQMPMLAVAMVGCASLAVPTGLAGGIPTGVQLVAERFREDICFDAGEVIEAAYPMATPVDPR